MEKDFLIAYMFKGSNKVHYTVYSGYTKFEARNRLKRELDCLTSVSSVVILNIQEITIKYKEILLK